MIEIDVHQLSQLRQWLDALDLVVRRSEHSKIHSALEAREAADSAVADVQLFQAAQGFCR